MSPVPKSNMSSAKKSPPPKRSPSKSPSAPKKSPAAKRKPTAKAQHTVLATGRFLRLVAVNGWEYVERVNVTGVVGIVAVTDSRKMLLVEQYRPPLGKRAIELPAGLAGDVSGSETEELADAVRRELLEETGYEASDCESLTEGPSSAGLTNEVIHFFRAMGLKKTGDGGGDHSEDIVVHEVPLESVDAWLRRQARRGLAIDPKIYAGLYFLIAAETAH
jgi:ADP-ribose pyrophosphatase